MTVAAVGVPRERWSCVEAWARVAFGSIEVARIETVDEVSDLLATHEVAAVAISAPLLPRLACESPGGVDALNADLVALVEHIDVGEVLRCIRLGATGAIAFRDLLETRLALTKRDPRPILSPSIAAAIASWAKDLPAAIERSCWYNADLTRRERAVLELRERGLSYEDVGDELHIAVDTVRSHLRNAKDKMRLASRGE